MSFARCARRHWFKYVAGVREPAIDRSGPDWGSAVARGQVVHDVLEHIREEAELAGAARGGHGTVGPDVPAPDAEPGREYREQARARDRCSPHPPGLSRPGRRARPPRELEFIHLAHSGGFLQGKIDLAAPDNGGIAALDVKTGGGDADALQRKADGYALQRSVYVGCAGGDRRSCRSPGSRSTSLRWGPGRRAGGRRYSLAALQMSNARSRRWGAMRRRSPSSRRSAGSAGTGRSVGARACSRA